MPLPGPALKEKTTTKKQQERLSRRPTSFAKLRLPFLSGIIFVSFAAIVEGQRNLEENNFWSSNTNIKFKNDHFDFESDDDRYHMEQIISWIVGVVVFFIVAIFIFILCLCCPLCMLAKIRSRRRGGVVYRSAVTNNGTTVTTERGRGGTTITIAGPQRAQTVSPLQAAPVSANQQLIAISNNANQPNKPYPQQQSVTIVPVIPVQTHPQYQQAAVYPPHHQTAYPHQPPQFGNSNDPPPPYPGLERDLEANNLPYNPYYNPNEQPRASAPSVKE